MGDAGRRLDRFFKGRGVDHLVRIENHKIGEMTLGDGAAAGQVELHRRQTGHAAHRLFQREQSEIARVMAKHPRKRAP